MATVVKTIRTECGQYEAKIEQRADSVFAIKLFKWTEEWVKGYGKVDEFWEPITQRAVFTDTLQNAERLAAEELRMHGKVRDETGRLTSESLAALIVDALICAKIINVEHTEIAIRIATEEVNARKAAGDY